MKDISLFKILHFVISQSNDLTCPNTTTILVSDLDRKLDIFQGGDGSSSIQRRLYLEKIKNTQLKLTTYDTSVKVFKIVGVNF